MSFRSYLEQLSADNKLVKVRNLISSEFEISAVLNHHEPNPVRFDHVNGHRIRVAGNLFCDKSAFSNYFDLSVNQIISFITNAIKNHHPPEIIEQAACQEVILENADLDSLPILRHFESDGGRYITSGVFITRHPVYGQNMDFHRCMQISKNEMAVRVVRSRHFDTFLQDQREIDVAICIGNSPSILAAAATSVELGLDELEIANVMESFKVVRCHTSDLLVPADTEIVLEGSVHVDKRHQEGPFVDLTRTEDIIRQEPVFELKTITHRFNPIYHALLPGGLEHKLLMGMPREPTIFEKVDARVKCLDVSINPGGSSWLHAIVQIDKTDSGDGIEAIHAAFDGHRSCKHVYIVDKDIDIYNPEEVEWAMATRFQGDKDMVVFEKEPGSSLDPSAELGTKLTTKIGFDLTAPVGEAKNNFKKVQYPHVDMSKFLN